MCTTFSSEPLMVVNPQSHWKYSGGFHPVNLELVVTEPIPHIPWIQLWLHVQKHGGFLGTPPGATSFNKAKLAMVNPARWSGQVSSGRSLEPAAGWLGLTNGGWFIEVNLRGLVDLVVHHHMFFWTCYMFHDVMHLVLITQHNILRSSQVYKSMSIICLTNRDMVGQDLSYILIAYFVKTMWFT